MNIFLHHWLPSATLLSFGPITIHWYGLCLVLAIFAAILTTIYLGRRYQIDSDTIFNLSFWLIIGGLAGARLYDVILELPYYLNYPIRIFAIWQGGLAIHGAIIAGLIISWFFAKHHDISFFKLCSLLVPGLALGQAIGRWGNYFNQELFGLPTNLPWGIPISLANRPAMYISSTYFHPTFLYESLGCLIIFLVLLCLNLIAIKKKILSATFFIWSTALYMVLYSVLRFSLEFIKIDITPVILGLRWPQLISLVIFFSSIFIIIYYYAAQPKKI